MNECVFELENGVIQGLLQILMLNLSAHITKQLGMAPGGEFRAAFREVLERFSIFLSFYLELVNI